MNITDYKVIEANVNEAAGLREFNEAVTQALREGWQPHGNMVSSWGGAGETFYSQPMVKYEVEGAGSIVDPGRDDLLDAAQGVLNNWSGGNLAGAVRRLGFVVGEIRDAEEAKETDAPATTHPAAQVLQNIYDYFPGLQDGATDVNGGDLVDWFNANKKRIEDAIEED